MSILGTIALKGKDLPHLHSKERRVLENIGDCQTGRLGANVMGCICGHHETHWNSCRDRHCPLCQGASRARWVADRLSELLPCPYFHVVFTVPYDLRGIAYANKTLFYQALFEAVHETLLDVGASSHRHGHPGGRLGGMSILHTWNQKLNYHPHVHCIIPGGTVALDASRWISSPARFLLPVRILSKVFCGKLLERLSAMHSEGRLFLVEPHRISRLLQKSAGKKWVVYAKQPFGGPQHVLKYLGRYTHRVGISEQRMVAFNGAEVRFSWLNRARGHCREEMRLSHECFVQRFLLHLLPTGLRKIRYFGYMANRDRSDSLRKVRALVHHSAFEDNLSAHLVSKQEQLQVQKQEPENPAMKQTSDPMPCPRCGKRMILLLADRWMRGSNSLRHRIVLKKCMPASRQKLSDEAAGSHTTEAPPTG